VRGFSSLAGGRWAEILVRTQRVCDIEMGVLPLMHDILVKAYGGSSRVFRGAAERAIELSPGREAVGSRAQAPEGAAENGEFRVETFSFAPLGLPRTGWLLDPGLVRPGLNSLGPPGLSERTWTFRNTLQAFVPSARPVLLGY
jgi:hypothetical protein